MKMIIKCVEFDHKARRAVRIVTDPVDLLRPAAQMRWPEFCNRFMAIEGDIDLENQTINGEPIRAIYERNSEQRLPLISAIQN